MISLAIGYLIRKKPRNPFFKRVLRSKSANATSPSSWGLFANQDLIVVRITTIIEMFGNWKPSSICLHLAEVLIGELEFRFNGSGTIDLSNHTRSNSGHGFLRFLYLRFNLYK